MKEKIKYLLMIVSVLVVIGIGITFAYFTSRVTSSGTTSGTTGTTVTVEDTIVEVEGNLTFDDLDIYPGHKNISSITVTATGDMEVYYHLLWTGTNSLNTPLNYYVYKSTTNESPSISCSKQREVVDGSYHYYEECTETNFTNLGEVVSRGQISSTTESIAVQLLKNESLQATSEGAIVYYYVVLEYPNEEENQNIDIGGSFDGEVSIEFLSEPELLASEKIENLYEDNQDILAYDGTEDNNLRYIGADPANYVYFNCDDYSNPSSDTCELWRIIGIMNNIETADGNSESLVKLIRSESLGDMAWDSGTFNDWSEASLQELLNGDYLNRTGSYSSTGITSETRDMIETVTWKLGGRSSNSNTSSEFYIAERGTVYSGNPTEWEGKIALMYPSDYGFATSGGSTGRNTCLSYTLYNWRSYGYCYINDWLYNNDIDQWTLAQNSSSSSYVFFVHNGGYERFTNAYLSNGVRPSVYLTSEVRITGGDGTANNAYTLEV